tara:strand:+ start:639 stop:1112 length:474 start_codon:yes stop_codon:yes gene_type:complete
MYKIAFLYLFILFLVFNFNKSFSKGDLTRQKAIEVEVNLKGEIGKVHFFEPSTLKFETGKLYMLKIKNLSDSKHYFTSEKFSNSIFTRKIQINKNNSKVAEVKGIIKEVEVFPHNIVEWWFVPLKTGEFNDLFCKIKDKITLKTHEEMGMKGKIIIE